MPAKMTPNEFEAAFFKPGTTLHGPGQATRPHPDGGARWHMGTVGPGGTWETEDDMWAWVYRDMEDDDLPVRLTPPLPDKLEGNAGLLLDAMQKVEATGLGKIGSIQLPE